MSEHENILSGVVWLFLGSMILLNWRWLVNSSIASGNAFFERLGVPQASEATRKKVGEIIAKTLGALLVICGVVLLLRS